MSIRREAVRVILEVNDGVLMVALRDGGSGCELLRYFTLHELDSLRGRVAMVMNPKDRSCKTMYQSTEWLTWHEREGDNG